MNTESEVVAKLKSILDEIGVEYSTILLFGSRTGKNFEEEVVLRWLRKAENDLKTVKHLYT
jgi:hypothetical protein